MNAILRWLGLVFAGIAAFLGNLPVTIQVLLVVMLVDILLGFLRAFSQARLESGVALAGMTRKVGIILIVALAYYVGEISNLPGVPVALGSLAAGFYIYQESLSILENSSVLGLPIPDFLKDALAQLSTSTGRRKAKMIKTTVESKTKTTTETTPTEPEGEQV